MAGRTRAQKGQLAAELTSFVDRRAAMVEVKRLLSTARLVTLTGVGGTGKPRLATHRDRAQADGYLREALPLQLGLGNTVGICQTLEVLGMTATSAGDPVRAARLTGAGHRPPGRRPHPPRL